MPLMEHPRAKHALTRLTIAVMAVNATAPASDAFLNETIQELPIALFHASGLPENLRAAFYRAAQTTLHDIAAGGQLLTIENKDKRQDYTYLKDILEEIIHAAQQTVIKLFGQSVSLAKELVTAEDLAERLAKAYGKAILIEARNRSGGSLAAELGGIEPTLSSLGVLVVVAKPEMTEPQLLD